MFLQKKDILCMTAQAEGYGAKEAEYHGAGTYLGNFVEGLARNYWEPYEACQSGSQTCSNSKLYQFLSGYQPWWDGSKSPAERATYLAGYLGADTYRTELEADVRDIVDYRTAEKKGWTTGKIGNRPWQWHNMVRPPNSGEALGYIYWSNGYGNYFWLLTADQDWYFKKYIKPIEYPY
jgi:hypothetical protein